MEICSPVFLIDFSRYIGQRRQFLMPGAFTVPTSSFHVPLETRSILFLACEQALLGVGGAGGTKRRELATMSQEFSFLR